MRLHFVYVIFLDMIIQNMKSHREIISHVYSNLFE
jgi:hypothetical protein